MRWLSSGLFRKFLFVMGALALLPVGFLAFKVIGLSRHGIQAAVLELHTKLAEKLAERVDGWFKVNDDKLSFALASLQKKMEWSDKQELLRSLIETHSDVVEVSILNGEGREVLKVYNPDLSSGGDLVSRAGEEGFRRFLGERRKSVTLLAEGETPTLLMYYPMNKLVLARIVVSLRGLASSISGERVGGTGFAVLVDEQGKPLFFPAGRLDAGAVSELPRWPIVAAALQSQSIGSSEFADSRGLARVGAYAPVSAIKGAVLILQDKGEAYVSARQMRRAAAGVVLFVIAFSFLSATFLARRLTAPLLALTRGAEAVSRGDFTARVDMDTGDELQELAETFNRMTAQLRSYSVLQVDKLIAEQRKTDAILYSISDGIMMVDQQGRIALANRRAREMFGLNPELALEGKVFKEATPESLLQGAVLDVVAEPREDLFKEVDLSTEQSRRFLRVNARQVITPGRGLPLGALVVVRDVTLERELDKMKEEFLHYITHDLRNPLGSAMGFIDVLLKGTTGVLNPEQHRIVASLKRSTSRLMGLINNILDIAKMESGRMRLQLKTVSLAGVASRAMSILESLSQQKELVMRLSASEEFSLEADSDLLERVFTNLIGNAIKYTPTGGTITIGIEDAGAVLKCCVEDTGEGIPPEYCDRIFQKFEQVQGQRRGGTGLGLTITKFFVESHLGRIWVESEPGKGSRFYFTVPKGLALDAAGAAVAPEVASR
jgi:NtrC-family two-component system sensor histidine kinase KinB